MLYKLLKFILLILLQYFNFDGRTVENDFGRSVDKGFTFDMHLNYWSSNGDCWTPTLRDSG